MSSVSDILKGLKEQPVNTGKVYESKSSPKLVALTESKKVKKAKKLNEEICPECGADLIEDEDGELVCPECELEFAYINEEEDKEDEEEKKEEEEKEEEEKEEEEEEEEEEKEKEEEVSESKSKSKSKKLKESLHKRVKKQLEAKKLKESAKAKTVKKAKKLREEEGSVVVCNSCGFEGVVDAFEQLDGEIICPECGNVVLVTAVETDIVLDGSDVEIVAESIRKSRVAKKVKKLQEAQKSKRYAKAKKLHEEDFGDGVQVDDVADGVEIDYLGEEEGDVVCPECGYVGDAEDFANGSCPACGAVVVLEEGKCCESASSKKSKKAMYEEKANATYRRILREALTEQNAPKKYFKLLNEGKISLVERYIVKRDLSD